MAKKRANGEGSIRKRSDGRWEGRYTAGYHPETGKRIIKNIVSSHTISSPRFYAYVVLFRLFLVTACSHLLFFSLILSVVFVYNPQISF